MTDDEWAAGVRRAFETATCMWSHVPIEKRPCKQKHPDRQSFDPEHCVFFCRSRRDDLIAALAAAGAQIMPKVATDAMCDATGCDETPEGRRSVRGIYHLAIAAAPKVTP